MVPKITWDDKIKKAEIKGVFSFDDTIKADDWQTNALGEMYKLDKTCFLDDSEIKAIYGNCAYKLGVKFRKHVNTNSIRDAKRTLDELRQHIDFEHQNAHILIWIKMKWIKYYKRKG